jgi:hypothetical protein
MIGRRDSLPRSGDMIAPEVPQMQSLSPALVVMAAAWMVAGAAAGTQPRPRAVDTSKNAVLKTAASYVAAYEERLTSIVADEAYTQRILAQGPGVQTTPWARTLHSEIFFAFGPHERQWMAIRDVLRIDGAPNPNRLDLKSALVTLAPRDVARTFTAYNARYNLGRIKRNFNEPTLSLLVLDQEHRDRFSFDRGGVQQTPTTSLVTLKFEEKRRPALIASPDGKPVFTKGELLVDAATGEIHRTVLTLKIDALRVELSTAYARDERLGMLVPTIFREVYEDGVMPGIGRNRPRDSGQRFEHITCTATYSNFRRYETSARMK